MKNEDLTIGWQDHSYGRTVDPKKELAESLIREGYASKLSSLMELHEEDFVNDYIADYNYSDTSRDDEFTPEDGHCLTGNGEQVYCMHGESPDLTACDKECGYCGRCMY